MRFFQRNTVEILTTPTLDNVDVYPDETASFSICGPDVCTDNEPSDSEISRVEEIFLEQIEDAAQRWDASLETAKERLALTINILSGASEAAMQQTGSNRQDRREANSTRNTPNWSANQMANARNAAINHIKDQVKPALPAGETIEKVLASNDVSAVNDILAVLEGHLIVSKTSPCNMLNIDGSESTSPFQELYLHEYIARAWLALGAIQQPELMRQYISPTNLNLLPEAVQDLVSLDIMRGATESTILRLHATANESDLEGEGYLASRRVYFLRSDVSPQAKTALAAVAVGACAMGAESCPANTFGLCAQVLEKIDYANLPPDVRTDMARKYQSMAGHTTNQLTAFAVGSSRQLSRWWRSSEHIPFESFEQNGNSRTSTGKKRARSSAAPATAQSIVDSLVERPEQNTSLEQVTVNWKKATQPVEIDIANNEQCSGAVQAILDSDEFVAYAKKYANEKNLQQLLKSALDTILYSPRYRDVPSIVRMSYREPYYDDRGTPLTIWRLSGSAHAVNAGDVGRKTRIYFGMRGDRTSRHIHIIGVRHKTAIAKRMARSDDI